MNAQRTTTERMNAIRPRLLRAALAWLTQRRERLRQRQALGRLDERLLRDIGLTRYDAVREAGKPFWR